MSSPGTPVSADRARRPRRRMQSGQSMISVIGFTSIVALLVIASLTWARSSTNQSTRTARGDLALEAAEAGVQLYISRMVEDPRYYRRYVDTAEDPRTNTTAGGVVAPGSAWPTGNNWSYSGAPSTWIPLQNARFGQASYSLRVSPVPSDPSAVLVQSTARVMPSGGNNPIVKSVQARIQPISIADFQMISDATIVYGSSATTTGKLYSSQDIIHSGTALAPVYAKNLACRSGGSGCSGSQATNSAFQGGAFDKTTTPSFSAKFPTPIDFTSFTQDISDIKAAAQATGVYRNDATANGWMVQFLSTGQVRIWKITGSSNLGVTVNQLQCPTTVTLPGGATPFYMYFEQPAVVGNGNNVTDACNATSGTRASVVDGQVTLASKTNIYIGNNISYETDGDDVLGLVAGGEMIMSENTPNSLTWRAATLAQNGQWRTNTGSTTHNGTMTFTGSTATSDGGYASMFNNRVYNYDTTLQSLRPPLFPTIEGSWGVSYWREVTPPS